MAETKKYHFLDEGAREKLRESVQKFCSSDQSPEVFLMKIKEFVPVHKIDRETWKARVEGFVDVTDQLLERILEKARESRGEDYDAEAARKEAKVRPLSYYHYVTGSREPSENAMTPQDYFNDPTTALVKLEDDVLALCRLYRQF